MSWGVFSVTTLPMRSSFELGVEEGIRISVLKRSGKDPLKMAVLMF